MASLSDDQFAGAGRGHAWGEVRVLVVGFNEAGAAACDNLLFLGAQVTTYATELAAVDEERVDLLRTLGATIEVVDATTVELPSVDLLVVGSDDALTTALVDQARTRGIPVWGEVELAWRLRDPELEDRVAAPWLAITGSGATAGCAGMLAAIVVAAGSVPRVAGASGRPFVEAVMDPEPYDVLVADLTPGHLTHLTSMSAHAAVVLAADSADSGGLGQVFENVQIACVYNVSDDSTQHLVEEADVVEGARAVGFTLGMPSVSMVGLVDEILVDRAFIAERQSSAAELCTLEDLPSQDPAVVADALAAAALARAHGISRSAVRDGLRSLPKLT